MQIRRNIWFALFFIFMTASLSAKETPEKPMIDPRLDGFLAFAIKDQQTLQSERQAYAAHKISFEQFIFSVYSGGVRIDSTPDNSHALAQLGGYLEKNRPSLSAELLKLMEEFYSVKSNQTFMRGMFLETIRGIVSTKK